MFVKRKEFKDLQEQVAKLGREIAGKLDIGVKTGEKAWTGWDICKQVPLKDILEQILDHLGLYLRFTLARESKCILKKKIDLRAKSGKKKQDKKETEEK